MARILYGYLQMFLQAINQPLRILGTRSIPPPTADKPQAQEGIEVPGLEKDGEIAESSGAALRAEAVDGHCRRQRRLLVSVLRPTPPPDPGGQFERCIPADHCALEIGSWKLHHHNENSLHVYQSGK